MTEVSATAASATGASAIGVSAIGASATGTTIAPALGLLELGVWASDLICDSQQDSLGATWGHLGKGALPGVGTPGGDPVKLLSRDNSSPS